MSGLNTEGLADPFESSRSALRFAWHQLDASAHRKLIWVTVALSLLSLADFVAVLMIAGVTALIVASFSSEGTPTSWGSLQIPELSPLMTIVLLGGGAITLIALKTLVSWWLIRRTYLFMASQQPVLASKVYQTYLAAPFSAAQLLTRTQVVNAITAGSSALLTVLRGSIALIADATLILLLITLMLTANPILFFASAAYFSLLAFVTSSVLGRRISLYSREALHASLAAQETMQASVGFSPEIRLYGMAQSFIQRFSRDELLSARYAALQTVLFQAPRYVFEMGVLVGFVVVAAIAFVAQTPAQASFTVALFALTSVRLVPALQRMNGTWGSMRSAKAITYALLPILELPPAPQGQDHSSGTSELPAGSFVLDRVGYQYPRSSEWALQDVNLTVAAGTVVALVGRTGSGKSTLANVIAGLSGPTTGSIIRGGGPEWRSRLAMVPQDVYLAADTIRNNVALPILGEDDEDDEIWAALELAQVADVVSELPDGLDAWVGENGSRFSGGEVQRIGLARALYRRPNLLILDEATSSLDAHTERRVTDSVRATAQSCTLVVVAHRLSTVRDADLIVYLEQGRVIAAGTFDYITSHVPAFAEAATLQGILQAEPVLDLQGTSEREEANARSD